MPMANLAEETEAEEPEPLTLAQLEGAPGREGVLQRWLVPGFYVSLDTTMRAGERRYWRTQANGFVPLRSIRPVRPKRFSGVLLAPPRATAEEAPPQELGTPAQAGALAEAQDPLSDVQEPESPEERGAGGGEAQAAETEAEEAWRLPLGFVLSRRTQWYRQRPDGRVERRRGLPGYHHRFSIQGTVEDRGVEYLIGADGALYRARDITRIDAVAPPDDVGEGEPWIDVDLTTQTLVAYEGEVPVFATLISSGRTPRSPDEEDYLTPVGSFRILSKHVTHTMDGDSATDGPYSIDDVPYVMYFKLAYALHSAFWHNSFGRPRSHGCINLSPHDARWLFNWAGPTLPAGWHGAYPNGENPGTYLRIRGETPDLWRR